MSTYIYGGADLYRLETGIHEKIRKLGIDKDHIVSFDAESRKTFRMENVLMECDTFSLFDTSDKKAVIVKNPWFLNASAPKAEKNQKDSDRLEEQLEKYLHQPNPTTELFFYCHGYEPDTRRKIYKMLEKHHAEIVLFKAMKDREFAAYAESELKKNHIVLTKEGLQTVLERCSLDTLKLHQAVEKLLVYGENHPDDEAVSHIVASNDEVDVFKLSNMFIAGNLDGTMKAYNKMLLNNEQIPRMISLLAGSIRRYYNMKVLYQKGMGEEEIAVRLHQRNKWAVHFGLQNASYRSAETLLRLLKELADLDQDSKAGLVDQKDGFEDFLIRNGNRNAGN